MRDLGSGQVEFHLQDGKVRQFEGEVELKGDRCVVTEIIYINGSPAGAREINLPLAQCVVYWKPEVFDENP
jgi:hypothetical protein